MAYKKIVSTAATATLVANAITPLASKTYKEEKELGELVEVKESMKAFKYVDHAKQNTWYRKVMQRPQRSRHTRTKRGRK